MTAAEIQHTCAVCPKSIARGLLMCGPHWRLVPADVQRRVNRAWRDLKLAGSRGSLSAVLAYRGACKTAITSAAASIPADITPEPGATAA